MSKKPTFTSKISVDEIQQVGSDLVIARAARASTKGMRAAKGSEETEEKVFGLIKYLMSSRHGVPFEHGTLTVRVHAPIKVFREWHRHRIGWSYSELSARYADLEPRFYLPPPDRPMIQMEGFKSARPEFRVATADEYERIRDSLKWGYEEAYQQYEAMLALDVDRGLARDVLGVGIYSACYCTANPRSLMAFLELRTNRPDAKRPSKPLWEIEQAATELEVIFARHWPLTYRAWNECGRMAP